MWRVLHRSGLGGLDAILRCPFLVGWQGLRRSTSTKPSRPCATSKSLYAPRQTQSSQPKTYAGHNADDIAETVLLNLLRG